MATNRASCTAFPLKAPVTVQPMIHAYG